MYYAHSTGDVSRSDWQLLADHLDRVADEAARFGARFGVEAATRLAGLLHDLGKYTRAFQARLEGSKESVDHSTAGAALVMRLAKAGKLDDSLIAELVAYSIAGHHAGLPDKQGESFSALSDRLKAFSEGALDPAWETEISPDAAGLMPAHFHWAFMNNAGSASAKNAAGARLAFQLAFLGRMIFSCLVDADYLDTERFYAEAEGLRIDRGWPALGSELPRLIDAFERHMAGLGTAETPVNRLRKEILEHVRRRAGEAPGLYTLTVPTGGGKTLASLGFALDHARAHGHERIIYAIPFAGARIETCSVMLAAGGDTSRPSRRGADRNAELGELPVDPIVAPRAGARIETQSSAASKRRRFVAPRAGARIETGSARRGTTCRPSPLAQGRGSKPFLGDPIDRAARVAPRAGARIETPKKLSAGRVVAVAPRAGARIETAFRSGNVPRKHGRPSRRGADRNRDDRTRARSASGRPSRRGADRN